MAEPVSHALRRGRGFRLTAKENSDSLTDIRSIGIDITAAREERLKSFVRQIKDPYRFKVGNTVVRVNFCGERDLSSLLADILSI